MKTLLPLSCRMCRYWRRFYGRVAMILLIFAGGSLEAHDDTQTHSRLSVAAFLFLDQSYPEDGMLFSQQFRTGVRQGSIDEDNGLKFQNHFFNPKTGRPLFPTAQTAPGRAGDFWPTAVAAWRASDQATAVNDLGAVMHLLQDMTSPAHVHNDQHGKVQLGHCEGDGDDFEIWGYCDDIGTNAILQYIRYNSIQDSAILPRLATGLSTIFGNQPQRATPGTGENMGYASVRSLANSVYDFTTFQVTLRDTWNGNDPGAGELKTMFSSLEETTAPAAWWIGDIGYSQGECNYTTPTAFNESWWIMPGCVQRSESFGTVYVVEGYAYIENTGGGTGASSQIPETLIPAQYDRPWFIRRYGSKNNTARTPMLRIYGDVLYAAAVAHGAGLLQAYLDEAIMPKPVTAEPTQITGASAQLNGRVRPSGQAASAWFEWGSSTNYGTVTTLQDAGAGNNATNLAARITGLTADAVYHFRIVSSNRYGIRRGTNYSFRTPTLVVAANSPNAWQITDASTASGSTLSYTTNLTAAHRQAATNSGWRYTITSRLVDDFGGTMAINFLYQAAGNRRFLVWWDLDNTGNLTAQMEGQPVRVLATNGLGANGYHTHELRYTNGTATYVFDGTVVGSWTGAAVSATAGLVSWGSGSSPGMGQMNFRDVEFAINGIGVVGAYHAGTGPAAAPSPVTQGWSQNPPAPQPPLAVTGISPDFEGYLADVATMPATQVQPVSARLNGRVNPQGQNSTGWFEWGTSTSYGNRTAARSVGSGRAWLETNELLGSLITDQTYHYRFAASNSFTVVFGADQVFRTGGFVVTNTAFAAVDIGSVSWGDCDNDADLDVLITGQSPTGTVSRIYRNNGNGSFTDINVTLPAVNWSAAVWGDYNNDGRLDIVISGVSASGPITRIYRNSDGTNFVNINAVLPGLAYSSLAWFDYDNDGDLDILVAGQDATTNRLARIYRNDRGTNFVDINAVLVGLAYGAVVTADFDLDTDLDIVLTGLDNTGAPRTEYYRNDGDGVFSALALDLPGVQLSSVAAGDYDGDGDPDLALSGASAAGGLTGVFRNVRNGNIVEFEPVVTPLAAASSGSVTWGDYDNDGDLDIVVAGWRGVPFADIYRNEGDDVFTPLNAGLTGAFWSSVGWGDYDKDGDLDLLVTGRDDQGGQETRAIRLYRNESLVSNTAPTAPSGLAGSGVGDHATVTWQAASDNQTISPSLSYNLVLSSVTNGINVASPMANLTNGYRRVVQAGNAGQNLSWNVTGLSPGTYYFSVQAVDSAYAGGSFAPWQAFNVAPPPIVIADTEILQPGRVRIHFVGSDGVAYEVWASTDLQNWTKLGPGLTLAPGEFEYIDAAAPLNRRFYQVRRVTP